MFAVRHHGTTGTDVTEHPVVTRRILIAAVIVGFALVHGIALFQINSASPRAVSNKALFDSGD